MWMINTKDLDGKTMTAYPENTRSEKVYIKGWNDCLRYIHEYVKKTEAEPVRHSHWVKCNGDRFAPIGAYGYCHLCHFFDSEPYNWCHGCGAKMDAKETST